MTLKHHDTEKYHGTKISRIPQHKKILTQKIMTLKTHDLKKQQ